MISLNIQRCGVAILLTMLLSSCATVKYSENIADYRKEMSSLEKQITENPRDGKALRDLGVIHFQAKQYLKAKEYLGKAFGVDATDAKTLFYYGMTFEADSAAQAALDVYINYTNVSVFSPYRKLIEGRYRTLVRTVIRQQLDSLVRQEDRLGDPTSSSVVAVFPLAYRSENEKYSSLGTGLSEMIISDLGQVRQLHLIERIRVHELLDELKFGQSKQVDPTTAPRIGRFLSAGRIVSGSYNVSADNQLRMDVASLDVVKKQYPEPASKSDAVENLFRVQKDLVFGIINNMGITLTKEESERIQRIPTKNLQAFLLYSKGLEMEDAGNSAAAEDYYKKAVSLDPNFSDAQKKTEMMEAMSFAGRDMGSALASAYKIEPPIPSDGSIAHDLLTNRLQILARDIGASFDPGRDNRKPPEEAWRSGAAVGDLPLPPDPPTHK